MKTRPTQTGGKAAVRFLAAVDRLIAAAKQVEQAKVELLAQYRQREDKRQ